MSCGDAPVRVVTIIGPHSRKLEQLCQNSLSSETFEFCVMKSRSRKLLFRKEVVRNRRLVPFRDVLHLIAHRLCQNSIKSSLKTRLNGLRTCRQIKLRWCPGAVSKLCQNPSDSRHWRYA